MDVSKNYRSVFGTKRRERQWEDIEKYRRFRKKPVNVLGFFSKCPGLFWSETPAIKTLWNPEFCFGARNGGPRGDKTKSPEPVGEWLRHASLRSAPHWLLWLSFVPPGTPIKFEKKSLDRVTIFFWGIQQIFASRLDKFGQVWTNLDEFGQVWTSLDKFGQVWTSLDRCKQVQTGLNRCKQV